MISPEQYFYCKNGEVLKSLDDLKKEIKANCDSVNLDNFYHHVTNDNNDYVSWIRGVFKNEELAKNLVGKNTPKEFLDAFNLYFNKKELGKSRIIGKKPVKKEDIKPKFSRLKRMLGWGKKLFFSESDEHEDSDSEKKKDELNKNNSLNKEIDVLKSKETNNISKNSEDLNDSKDVSPELPENEKDENVSLINKLDLSERTEKLLEKTKAMKKKSYLDLEKQKETVSDLMERYEELYSLISVYRKSGYDMFIPQMNLRLIKPKIHFLEVSDTLEERTKVRGLLDEVLEEVEEALKNEEPDLKKEILQKAKVNNDVVKKVENKEV